MKKHMQKHNGRGHILGFAKDDDGKVPTVLWVAFGTVLGGVISFGIYEMLRKK